MFDAVQRWVSEPPPDHLFEITETSIAMALPRSPAGTREQKLTLKALNVSPVAPNLMRPELFREALPRLGVVDRSKRPSAALVIPDYAVRMAVLDFEEFPAGSEERTALVRFRMRKSVPFPIEEAQVAYSLQVNEAKRVEVLAVAIARPILLEYEELLSDAGYRLGLVTPSCVAALPLCTEESNGLRMLTKVAGSILSVVLLDGPRVRLVRCLNLADSEVEAAEADPTSYSILPLLQQTLAYAEDQIGQPVKRMLFCGFGSETSPLGAMAQEEFGIPYSQVRSRFGPALQENAGLLGMLEQYAA